MGGPAHSCPPIEPVSLPVAVDIVCPVCVPVVVEAVTGLNGLAAGVAGDVLFLLIEVEVASIVGLHDLLLPSTSLALATLPAAAAAASVIITSAGRG